VELKSSNSALVDGRWAVSSVDVKSRSSDQEYLTRYFSYIAPSQGPLAVTYVALL